MNNIKEETNIKMEYDHTTSETETQSTSTQTIHPDKAIQDLFQWVGKMASDFTMKLNGSDKDFVETSQITLKNLYSKVGSMMLQGHDVYKMTAQEIRSKTSDELYQNIKINIILYRDICKYDHQTNCVSVPILDEVKKRLVEEGFEVNYVIGERSTNINIQW